jgi:hypothetical protein
MIAKSLIPALAAIFALAACGEETPAPAASAPAAAPSASYKVQVTFTPRTLEKLKELGEKVTVANMFFGLAGPATPAADKSDDGQVQLGEVMRDIAPQNQIITVAEPRLDAAKLAHIDGKPMLLINVYSARQKAPDNLLSCGIFDDTLEKAEAAPIEIECDLIEPEVIEHAPIVAPTDEN